MSTTGVPSKKQKIKRGGCATCCCFAAKNNDMEDKENEPPSNTPAEIETVSFFLTVVVSVIFLGVCVYMPDLPVNKP